MTDSILVIVSQGEINRMAEAMEQMTIRAVRAEEALGKARAEIERLRLPAEAWEAYENIQYPPLDKESFEVFRVVAARAREAAVYPNERDLSGFPASDPYAADRAREAAAKVKP